LKSSRFTAEAELISCAPESRVTYISFPWVSLPLQLLEVNHLEVKEHGPSTLC
jgi:hypothetical protein